MPRPAAIRDSTATVVMWVSSPTSMVPTYPTKLPSSSATR